MGTRLQLKATGFFDTLNQYKIWAISSVGRTLALQAGCHRFESDMCPLNDSLVKTVSRLIIRMIFWLL